MKTALVLTAGLFLALMAQAQAESEETVVETGGAAMFDPSTGTGGTQGKRRRGNGKRKQQQRDSSAADETDTLVDLPTLEMQQHIIAADDQPDAFAEIPADPLSAIQELSQSTGTNIPASALLGGNQQASPYGPFDFSIGGGKTNGFNVLGTGFEKGNKWRAGWPHGFTKSDGIDVNALGRRVFSKQDQFGVGPDGAISQWNWGKSNGLKVLGSGFQKGNDCTAGINGYRCANNRLQIPVLGTNVVDKAEGSGFDLSNFRFQKGQTGQYGPINIDKSETDISSPWLGNLVQKGIYNGMLKKAGYSGLNPEDKGVGVIPGVPLIG